MKFNKQTKNILLLCVLYFINFKNIAQSQSSELFSDDLNLNAQLSFDFKDLYKNTNDSTFIKSKMLFSINGLEEDSMTVRVRVRGNFRKKICYFKPMRLEIRKKQAENTIFENNRKLKLVVPCQNEKGKDELIYKELLAYKFFEELSGVHLKTQPLTLKIIEKKGNKEIEHTMFAFLIEDDNKIAKRHDIKKFPKRRVSPLIVTDSSAINFAMFSYMIGNTDWSMAYQHNTEMFFNGKKLIAIPYDFDHSGLVNAYYAKPNPMLKISSVTERVYRGLCNRDPEVFSYMRDLYISKEENIYSRLNEYKDNFNEKEYNRLTKYIRSFFDIVRSESEFKEKILSKCRG
ncbi:MAG: hypothetical protein VX706_01950 [Bacteroidota bacterium]|nr:hypothetical protein [Bacteroidota bacterium]|tara:strand:+ start:973 stop:2007 length:1035 start_codon:yes stop_codon:yes gene_type:complete